jgi:uncharacterized protein YraI
MKRTIGFVTALALSAPMLASAAQGWVVADISLQAGPDTAYPSIVQLRAGTPVSIQGCIDGWSWCDVAVGDDAGWVPGTFLEEDYGGQRVVVIDYGPRIGIPVVAFSLGVYWDRHYHSRPFYAQRQEWTARSITPHAPPRPAGVAATSTRQAPAATAPRDQQRSTPPVTTATTPTDRSTRTVRTQPAQEPERSASSASATASTTRVHEAKPERAPAPVAQHEPKAAAPSDATPQAKTPAEPPKAAPAQRTAMQQQPKAEQKPRSNEPKAKDELKAPPKKGGADKKKDDDNGGGGG